MRLVEMVLLETKDEYVVKAFGSKIAAAAKAKVRRES